MSDDQLWRDKYYELKASVLSECVAMEVEGNPYGESAWIIRRAIEEAGQ